MSYEVYATRWDDPHVVEELIPAKDLSFSLPLNDHGEASFTATVEPGRSFWRAAVSLPVSGILIARDGVPIWQGWITNERKAGERSFSFSCSEWGHFFEEKVPAVSRAWTGANRHQIIRDLLTDAQAISGQDVKITTDPTTLGRTSTDWMIEPWTETTVGRELRAIAEVDGGPEWYYGTTGTLDNPVRQLILGDRLGHTEPQITLEFVEDTLDFKPASAPPRITLLGDLYGSGSGPTTVQARRAGGNLLAHSRLQDVTNAATVANAIGSGEEAARLRATSVANGLLKAGYPRMTRTTAYDEEIPANLQLRALADLLSSAGVATDYSLVSLDSAVDWTQIPRGSSVQVILDTDVYGAERPVGGQDGFTPRLYDTKVRVPDEGEAQVEFVVSTVREV